MTARTRRVVFIAIFVTAGFSISYAEVCPADEKKHFTYRQDHSNGPEHWGETSPLCDGHRQSPINIVTSQVLKPDEPQILMLRNFDKPVEEVLIRNDGLFFTIQPTDGIIRSLILDGIEYPFAGFHFHFGNITDNGGSEHTIDGKRFPMEAHLNFLSPVDLVIQVSSLFEINDAINPAIRNILSVKSAYEYEGGIFAGKIPRNSSNPRRRGRIYLDHIIDLNCPYFRYTGSLATPPCVEGTPWLICKTHKYVNASQLKRLFTVDTVKKDEDEQKDCYMINNNRPIQESNNRAVYG